MLYIFIACLKSTSLVSAAEQAAKFEYKIILVKLLNKKDAVPNKPDDIIQCNIKHNMSFYISPVSKPSRYLASAVEQAAQSK